MAPDDRIIFPRAGNFTAAPQYPAALTFRQLPHCACPGTTLVLSKAVLVLSEAVLVLSEAVLVLSKAVLVLSEAVLVLSEAVIVM